MVFAHLYTRKTNSPKMRALPYTRPSTPAAGILGSGSTSSDNEGDALQPTNRAPRTISLPSSPPTSGQPLPTHTIAHPSSRAGVATVPLPFAPVDSVSSVAAGCISPSSANEGAGVRLASRLSTSTPAAARSPLFRRLSDLVSTQNTTTPSSPSSNSSTQLSGLGLDLDLDLAWSESGRTSSGPEVDSDRASVCSTWSDHFKDQDTVRFGVERFVSRPSEAVLFLQNPLGSPPSTDSDADVVDLGDDDIGQGTTDDCGSAHVKTSALELALGKADQPAGVVSSSSSEGSRSPNLSSSRPLSPSPSISPRISASFGTRRGSVVVRPWLPPPGSPVLLLGGLSAVDRGSPGEIRLRPPSAMSSRTTDSISSFPWSTPSPPASPASSGSPFPSPHVPNHSLGLSSRPSSPASPKRTFSPVAAVLNPDQTLKQGDGRLAEDAFTPGTPAFDLTAIVFPDSPPRPSPTLTETEPGPTSLASTSSDSLSTAPTSPVSSTSCQSRRSSRGQIPPRVASLPSFSETPRVVKELRFVEPVLANARCAREEGIKRSAKGGKGKVKSVATTERCACGREVERERPLEKAIMKVRRRWIF